MRIFKSVLKELLELTPFLIAVCLLVCLCCSSTKTVYKVYEVEDVSYVLDSIRESGTQISGLSPVSYTNDDSVTVHVQIASLYRDGKACGSIKIREENGVMVISIIDQLKK